MVFNLSGLNFVIIKYVESTRHSCVLENKLDFKKLVSEIPLFTFMLKLNITGINEEIDGSVVKRMKWSSSEPKIVASTHMW